MDVAVNIAGIERYARKLAVAVNTGGHSIRVLNERSVSDGGNLCPLWLVILKSVPCGVRDSLELLYSSPWAVIIYTFLERAFASESKVYVFILTDLRRNQFWYLIPDINLYQQLFWGWEKLIFSNKLISLLGLWNSKQSINFEFGLISLDCRLRLLVYYRNGYFFLLPASCTYSMPGQDFLYLVFCPVRKTLSQF